MTGSTEACKHCGGKIVVYDSRLSLSHRVQRLRCKDCKQHAGKRIIDTELKLRIDELEQRIKNLEQSKATSI